MDNIIAAMIGGIFSLIAVYFQFYLSSNNEVANKKTSDVSINLKKYFFDTKKKRFSILFCVYILPYLISIPFSKHEDAPLFVISFFWIITSIMLAIFLKDMKMPFYSIIFTILFFSFFEYILEEIIEIFTIYDEFIWLVYPWLGTSILSLIWVKIIIK